MLQPVVKFAGCVVECELCVGSVERQLGRLTPLS